MNDSTLSREVEARQRAIATHSEQVGTFADRYLRAATDPYADCFAYSRRRLDVMLDRYLPRTPVGLRLLDVGCGTGHHLARFSRCGFDVAGVDGSSEMVLHARRANPGIAIECADVDRLPFTTASFDIVVCIEVLRYLPDIQGCIREIARVLRPGGLCLATATPAWNLNGYWIVNRLASTGRMRGLTPLRQYFTTSRRLRRQFRTTGFGAVDVHGVYTSPVNWIERLAPRRLPAVLRAWEACDAALADRPILREFANMFLVRAARDGIQAC